MRRALLGLLLTPLLLSPAIADSFTFTIGDGDTALDSFTGPYASLSAATTSVPRASPSPGSTLMGINGCSVARMRLT
jgi:hypothetical protein